jgi:hypothetical protein
LRRQSASFGTLFRSRERSNNVRPAAEKVEASRQTINTSCGDGLKKIGETFRIERHEQTDFVVFYIGRARWLCYWFG